MTNGDGPLLYTTSSSVSEDVMNIGAVPVTSALFYFSETLAFRHLPYKLPAERGPLQFWPDGTANAATIFPCEVVLNITEVR